MNAVAAIVRANLVRLVNARANAFFLVVLPLLIVFALGTAIGNSPGDTLVGVVDPEPITAGQAVLDAMAATDGIEIRRYESVTAMRDDVARRVLDVGWAASTREGRLVLRWYAASGEGLQVRGALESAARAADVADQAVAVVTADARVDPSAARAAIDAAAQTLGRTSLTFTDAGDPATDPTSIRAVLASGQLTLFIFLTSLSGAGYLLLTRQFGVTRRMRAGPVPVGSIIVGEALSRFVVALLQAGIVLVGAMVLFGVDWRAPGPVLALCAAMALVGCGAAMLLGTLAGTEQQAGALALLLGLVLAALGGSMQPLHFFPDGLRTVAFAVTPHAWMNNALWRILVDGDGFAQVWPAVAVLVGVGATLLLLAAVAMARTLR